MKAIEVKNIKIGENIWQGDIGLKRIHELPMNLKEKNKILAYGEATGHHHSFSTAKVMVDNNGNQFAVLEQPDTLNHQEHNPIIIPKGIYRVIRQREYDLTEGVRQVMD